VLPLEIDFQLLGYVAGLKAPAPASKHACLPGGQSAASCAAQGASMGLPDIETIPGKTKFEERKARTRTGERGISSRAHAQTRHALANLWGALWITVTRRLRDRSLQRRAPSSPGIIKTPADAYPLFHRAVSA